LIDIHWGRDILAGFASEVAVMLMIGVGILSLRILRPGGNASDSETLGERVGYYVAPPAAFVAVFFCALWAARSGNSGFFVNGALVGLVAVLLTLGFFFGAKPEHRFMYGVSFGLRLVAACMAGVVAGRLS
jgi:putative membrane protein (TIGR04086 family)